MRRLITIIAICLFLLTGCINKSSSPTNISKIQFLPDTIIAANNSDDEIIIHPEGIYAIDQNTLFIFGRLEGFSRGVKRTIILRSADGGKFWQEVGNPLDNHSMVNLLFVDHGIGYSLSVMKTNDVGMPMFSSTSDNGATWSNAERISVDDTRSFYPQGMEFKDSENGEIIFIDAMLIPHDRLGILSTSDGGKNWEEIFSVYIPYNEDYSNIKEAFDEVENKYSGNPGGYYGNHWIQRGQKDMLFATGHDYSNWLLKFYENKDEFVLLKNMYTQAGWKTVSIFSSVVNIK